MSGYDGPERREGGTDVTVHGLVDGARKWLFGIAGIMLSILGVLTGILVQSFNAGAWMGRVNTTLEYMLDEREADDVERAHILETLQNISGLDSLQNAELRRLNEAYEELRFELQAHRQTENR